MESLPHEEGSKLGERLFESEQSLKLLKHSSLSASLRAELQELFRSVLEENNDILLPKVRSCVSEELKKASSNGAAPGLRRKHSQEAEAFGTFAAARTSEAGRDKAALRPRRLSAAEAFGTLAAARSNEAGRAPVSIGLGRPSEAEASVSLAQARGDEAGRGSSARSTSADKSVQTLQTSVCLGNSRASGTSLMLDGVVKGFGASRRSKSSQAHASPTVHPGDMLPHQPVHGPPPLLMITAQSAMGAYDAEAVQHKGEQGECQAKATPSLNGIFTQAAACVITVGDSGGAVVDQGGSSRESKAKHAQGKDHLCAWSEDGNGRHHKHSGTRQRGSNTEKRNVCTCSGSDVCTSGGSHGQSEASQGASLDSVLPGEAFPSEMSQGSSGNSCEATYDRTSRRPSVSSFLPWAVRETGCMFSLYAGGCKDQETRKLKGRQAEQCDALSRGSLLSLRQESARDNVRRNWFDYIVSALLISNSITTGVQVNFEVTHAPATNLPVALRVVEILFLVFFVCELIARFRFEGLHSFFCGRRRLWNWFDFVMVVLQIAEVVLSNTAPDGDLHMSTVPVKFLRMVKIFRILRLVRVFRLVQDLHKLAHLIRSSFWPFIWALFLLAILTYVLAIICTQLVADSRRGDEALGRYFGVSVIESALVLFASSSGGLNWLDLVRVLFHNFSPVLGLLVCIYIMFVIFVVMNLVTGVFVESAKRQMQKEDDQEVVEKMMMGFRSADVDGNASLTLEEFYLLLQSGQMRDVFRSVGVGPKDANRLFLILDRNGKGELTPEDFVQGALKLRGEAKAYDLEAMRHEIWNNQLYIAELVDTVQRTLDGL